MMANPAFLAAFVQAVYTGDADGVIAVLRQYGFTNITDADEAAVAAALIKPVDQSQLRYIAGLYKITAPTDLQSIPMLISALDGSILCKPPPFSSPFLSSPLDVNEESLSASRSLTSAGLIHLSQQRSSRHTVNRQQPQRKLDNN